MKSSVSFLLLDFLDELLKYNFVLLSVISFLYFWVIHFSNTLTNHMYMTIHILLTQSILLWAAFNMWSSSDEEDLEVVEMIANRERQLVTIPRRTFKPRRLLCLDEDYTPRRFRQRFRIPRELVETLSERLDDLLRHDTKQNQALEPIQQLLLFLGCCGTNSFYHVTSSIHGPSPATVSRVIRRVAEAILSLEPEVVKFPRDCRLEERKFRNIAGFPCVIGTLDGSHIKVNPPSTDEDAYVNRHHYHSLNISIVSGAHHEIFFASERCPGSWHESRVLRTSTLWSAFEDNGRRPFAGAVLLGDSAYPANDWLVTPFIGELTPQQQRFNQSHTKTRSVVERTYGILKNRFQCLKQGLRLLKMDDCAKVIRALIVLHNMCIEIGDEESGDLPDTNEEAPDLDIATAAQNNSRKNQLLQKF